MADDSDAGMSAEPTRNEFTDETTQPLWLAVASDSTGQTRFNALFERLAEVLDLSAGAVERLVSELLVYVDATPATLTAAQLWDMRTGVFEVVDNVLPKATRERTRSRLEILLLDVAPLERERLD